jgi:hypothetical protein
MLAPWSIDPPPFAVCLALAAGAARRPPTRRRRGDREPSPRSGSAQGLQPVATRSLDLLYLRPGAARRRARVQIAPVQVEMREDWQRANRSLERARLRPDETQRLKDEVAAIVADELRSLRAAAGGGAGAPVLEARVVDLYLNAPEMQAAVASKTYTKAFGDMVLVAELRDGPGGRCCSAAGTTARARDSSRRG